MWGGTSSPEQYLLSFLHQHLHQLHLTCHDPPTQPNPTKNHHVIFIFSSKVIQGMNQTIHWLCLFSSNPCNLPPRYCSSVRHHCPSCPLAVDQWKHRFANLCITPFVQQNQEVSHQLAPFILHSTLDSWPSEVPVLILWPQEVNPKPPTCEAALFKLALWWIVLQAMHICGFSRPIARTHGVSSF